jgi:transposase
MKEQENLKSTVLKLYSAGSKVSDIVLQTGVPRSTVYYWIKNGIPKEMSPLNLRDHHFLKQKYERQEKIIAILKTAPCAATAPLQERLAAIEQMVSDEYNDNALCEALEVAKGTYYNHTLRNKRGETKKCST